MQFYFIVFIGCTTRAVLQLNTLVTQ